jgi:hypothetical protein
MAPKREKPEDIRLKLRQVEVLQGQGRPVSLAVRLCRANQPTTGLPLIPALIPDRPIPRPF